MTAEDIPPRRDRAPGMRDELETLTVPLETITPILGGAAAPRTLDDHDPVRVPGIRGQLRFWWRALYGHGKSPAELAREEAAIWGGVHQDEPTRSQVTVWISSLDEETLRRDKGNPRSQELYALWPAAENKRKRLPAAHRWRPGLRFELSLRFPHSLRESVERTLRAWILFGGIGSRTRRGCGSVTVQKKKRAEWLPKKLTLAALHQLFGTQVFVSSTHKANDMPSLRGATLLLGEEKNHGVPAWTDALQWLCDFRQKPGPEGDNSDRFARGPIRKKLRPPRKPIERPGRSRWPEPDKVRQLLARSRSHRWAHRPDHDKRPVWPRASFGLPIVGRFQKKDIHDQEYNPLDPGEFELCWRDDSRTRDRLASPLILKALQLENGKYVPIALWLERAYPEQGQVVLRRKGKRKGEIVEGSAAPFDRLRAAGDPELYAPLRGFETMKEAFTRWLEAEHRLTRLGGDDA